MSCWPLRSVHTFANKTSSRKVRRVGCQLPNSQLHRHLLPKCSLTLVMPFILDTLHNAIGAEKAALACEQLSARRATPGSRCEAGTQACLRDGSGPDASQSSGKNPSAGVTS